MLIAAHSITSGVVGSQIGSPAGAFFIGVLMHFLLDLIPHYDTTDEGKFTKRQIALILIDGLLGLFVILFYVKPSGSTFWFGALGGLAPDILDFTPIWKDYFQKTRFGSRYRHFHEFINSFKLSIVPGIFFQWAIILLMVLSA